LQPSHWSIERKRGETQSGLMLAHATKMAAEGALSPREYKQFLGLVAEHKLGNMSMHDYARAREIDPRTGETYIDSIRKQVAIERTGDRDQDARAEKAVAQKILRHLGLTLNAGGHLDDKELGKYLRENDLIAPDLRDQDGNAVLSDSSLGTEYAIAAQFPNDYQAGDSVREQRAEAEKAALKEPHSVAKLRKEMQISEKDVADFKRRDGCSGAIERRLSRRCGRRNS
jgi:hypothetical protein